MKSDKEMIIAMLNRQKIFYKELVYSKPKAIKYYKFGNKVTTKSLIVTNDARLVWNEVYVFNVKGDLKYAGASSIETEELRYNDLEGGIR